METNTKQKEYKADYNHIREIKSIQYDYKFMIGQIVYLVTDPEQSERMVVGYNVRPTGITYVLATEIEETLHYEIEITAERDIIKATT